MSPTVRVEYEGFGGVWTGKGLRLRPDGCPLVGGGVPSVRTRFRVWHRGGGDLLEACRVAESIRAHGFIYTETRQEGQPQ